MWNFKWTGPTSRKYGFRGGPFDDDDVVPSYSG